MTLLAKFVVELSMFEKKIETYNPAMILTIAIFSLVI